MTLWELIDRACERRVRLAIERPVAPINPRLLANVIGFGLITGFMGALFALFIIPIPKGNEQIVTYMIGQLSGFAGGVVAYHYTLNAQKVGEAQLDAVRTGNTSKLVDLATKALDSTPDKPVEETKPDVTLEPGQTAQAADHSKDEQL